MYRVGLIGNYGSGNSLYNGQTIKTKIVSDEVAKSVGLANIVKRNTDGGISFVFKMPFLLLFLLNLCRNIIIFPAQNGVRIIAPLLILFNVVFRRKLHYVVIGGWLPDFLEKRPFLSRSLKWFDWIYVETEIMKKKLNAKGFANVCVMPNFKDLRILKNDDLKSEYAQSFKFCTFSRVMKEKGIEDAANAIRAVNEIYGAKCELDIYGAVEPGQQEWFDEIQKKFPSYIKYKGCIPFEKSVDVLKDYYGLLFPTYYEGEGFAGTLLDSFAAGVPVIASDWRYNTEIVRDGIEGFLFKTFDFDSFLKKIQVAISNRETWNEMKRNCLKRAEQYTPQNVVKTLLYKLV